MDEMYVHAILKELQIISKSSRAYNQTSIGLGSIYFGGGTPSLAPIESIEKILEHVLNDDSPFYLLENAEITIEMDPGTFSLEKLQSLKQVGFNRISLGVQSFDDDILASIGRVHRRQDIFNSLAMIREVFGDTANYSLDIISGLPGLTLDKWTETLECATKLIPKPMHLSLYDLQIEQGTVFDKWYKNNGDELSSIPNKAPVTTSVVPPFLPTPEDCAFMYKYAAGYLKSKCYEHYEISSYAYLAGQSSPSPYRSRHNQIYWTPKGQWYGTFWKRQKTFFTDNHGKKCSLLVHRPAIGLGSTSSIAGKSLARPRLMSDYIDWVEHQEQCETPEWLPGGDDDEAGTAATRFERFTDLIMTRLRTSDGLDLSRVKESYINGEGLVLAILKGANLGLELGLVQQFRSPNGSEMLRLVDPNGFLYSNTIISNIFFELEALKVECFVDLSVARQSQAIVGESSDVAKQIPF